MIYEAAGVSPGAPRTKKFEYTAKYKTMEQKISYDAEIPPTEKYPIDEIISHICVQNKVLPMFREDVSKAFRRFIDDETWKYETEIGDTVVKDFLSKTMSNTKSSADFSCISEFFEPVSNSAKSLEPIEFAEQFQFIMRNSSPKRLQRIIAWERKMENEMSSLIRARDFELDRMYRECEQAVSSASTATVDESNNDDRIAAIAVPESGQYLSRLNERIREVSNNYAQQIRTLTAQHRKFYRNLIKSLYERDELPPEAEFALSSGDTPSAAVQRSLSIVSNSDSAKSPTKFVLDESFTIYLGAQLKTMHNARLVTCASLTDICRPPPYFEEDTLTTRRLQMNLTLYGRGLSGLILLVGRDPAFHINERTEFSRLCERSTELHFESFDEQLKKLTPLMPEARKELHNVTDDESLLPVGCLYVTRHSNLSCVQVIYHLVTDDSLESDEISSRHPCINGLRNAIRISTKCGVTTFTIPLLLVEKAKEHMNPSWCMKRAELIFKCVKGFLMEACSGSSTAGGPPIATTHFNVNFALPENLQSVIYAQILELFPAIFHMVPSVIM